MHPIFIPWCAGTSQKNVGLGLVPRQGRGAWHRRHLTLPSTNAPNFHTLVCRHQPEKCRAGANPRQGRGRPLPLPLRTSQAELLPTPGSPTRHHFYPLTRILPPPINSPMHLPRPAGNSPPRNGAKAARNRKKPPVSQKEEVLTQLKCPSSLAISVPLASDQIKPYCLR